MDFIRDFVEDFNSQSISFQYACYVICFFVVSFILSRLYYVIFENKNGRIFRQENPDAIRVYLIKEESSDDMIVFFVNGKPPVLFHHMLRDGLYLQPGRNTIEFQFSWEKWIIKDQDYKIQYEERKKLEVEVEIGKKYQLYFDFEDEDYIFEEKKY